MVTELVAISNRIDAPNGQYLGADLYKYHSIGKKNDGLTLDVKYTINLLYLRLINPNALHVQI